MPQLILFNKPYNVLAQFSGESHELTLADFIKIPEVYAAGRLDKKSEGLLLLTDNGPLQHQLSHPKFNKKKYYWVQVEGVPLEPQLQLLRQGLTINDQTFLPALVRVIPEPPVWPRTPPIRMRQTIPTSWLEIILKEGKNHQIRRMTAAVGYPTLRLIRFRISEWEMGALRPGEYKIITNINS